MVKKPKQIDFRAKAASLVRVVTAVEPLTTLIVANPQGMGPMVLSCPHAGRFYPPELLRMSSRSLDDLRQLEDAHMDALVLAAAAPDMPAVLAGHARAWLDLNRHPEEIDPAMIDPFPPPSGRHSSARIAAGLGLLPSRVSGRPVYATRIPAAALRHRIDTVHSPYHETVETLLARARDRHGYAVLVDCHSMPSLPRDRSGNQTARIVIGDRFGTSAHPSITLMLEEALQDAGFTTIRNKPYAGGYIVERHGMPAARIHAIQIEVDRALYLDQDGMALSAASNAVAGRLASAIGDFRDMVLARLGPLRAEAAE